MGSLRSFESHALAQLRQRLGAAEEDKQDLIAFARGHQGTVAAIHSAILLAMRSTDMAALQETVVHAWPSILGLDHCVLAVPGDPLATLTTRTGVAPIASAILTRAISGLPSVTLRHVDRGHALFAGECAAIRAEALIRVELANRPSGLLLLGQARSPRLEEYGGTELLRFLGLSLGAMLDRCPREAAT